MISIKERKYNLILGVLVGLVFAQLALVEGYTIQLEHTALKTNTIRLVAVLVFIIIVCFFNAKPFQKINLNRLSIYLFLVVLVSLIIAIQGVSILCRIILILFPNFISNIMHNELLSVNLAFLLIVLGFLFFLLVFVLLVNKKVKYIKFLTNEVEVIKREGFGKTIKVRGEDELATLCESINDMSVQLGEKIKNEKLIEQTKNELITNISHDLKTPLTSIVGYLELLNSDQLEDADKKQYIQTAYRSSLRLNTLVNELFEYTKLSGSDIKFTKDTVNLSLLLNQVVGENILNFSEKKIDVILKNPYPEVLCLIDSAQMLRVFENLISNAQKYSEPDSKFIVSLSITNQNILISFTNRCKCIKEEELELFFNRFYRQDKSRTEEGSGLGLAIARRIVELHEGSITAQKHKSDITFLITLPKA